MSKSSQKLVMISVMALLIGACQSVQTTQGGAVGVSRSQSMSVSAQELDQLATQQYAGLVQGARSKGRLNANPVLTARVRTIAQRLIAQTPVFRPDALKWNWEVNVIDSDEVNAFCMPGGKIGVYSGLIQKLQASDAELAAVIGHEISHALREHVREQLSADKAKNTGLQIGGLVLGVATGNMGLAQVGTSLGGSLLDVTMSKPRSRTAEVEADEMGTELAARAGYDPRAAMTLWQKMSQLNSNRPPEFLSTHPSPASREADLTRVSAMLMPIYQKANGMR